MSLKMLVFANLLGKLTTIDIPKKKRNQKVLNICNFPAMKGMILWKYNKFNKCSNKRLSEEDGVQFFKKQRFHKEVLDPRVQFECSEAFNQSYHHPQPRFVG